MLVVAGATLKAEYFEDRNGTATSIHAENIA
jgi:hypothetical protein